MTEDDDETPIKEELSVFNQNSFSSSMMRLANETPCFNKPSARFGAGRSMLGGLNCGAYTLDRLEESVDTATTSFQ